MPLFTDFVNTPLIRRSALLIFCGSGPERIVPRTVPRTLWGDFEGEASGSWFEGAMMNHSKPGVFRSRNLAATFGLGHNGRWPNESIRGGRMYAICFDLDQDQLRRHYPNAETTGAYHDIRRALEKFGFARQQGSVYFGNNTVTPVTCVMAVQAVQKSCPWFAKVVSDIRMLRIEEHNDLMPAIGELELPLPAPGEPTY